MVHFGHRSAGWIAKHTTGASPALLKLTRTFGQWIELRDERTGAVSRIRAVVTEQHDKVQFEIDAPLDIRVNRVPSASGGNRDFRNGGRG